MKRESSESQPNELLAELVDDREVTDFEQDVLGHTHLVNEIAALALSVQTPANIALFGAWGSGKSGIANLLGKHLRDPSVRARYGPSKMVVFDAFKFRNLPMRRHFLTEVGRQLLSETEAEKRRKALYSATSGEDVELPPLKELGKPLLWFLVLVAAFAGFALLAAGVVSLMGGPFLSTAGTILASGLAPAALFAGLLAIAGRTITVRRTTEAPSSEEEFEREFKSLVRTAGGDRLIVFVDELDRCAPNTVVEALDTIRTFLGVHGTVFVVAADQQVLENALTLRVQQATPADSLNPYYSSGTAYLDKVFNYQMSIPPLLPSRVTQYVADMLGRKQGIWESVDVDLVASVLIPSHVRSPRRVKMLINNFVLTHRALQGRVAGGQISAPIDGREAEIAKLVCLRTEFPLFARALTASDELPELVLALIDDPNEARPDRISEAVWQRAHDFSPVGSAPVAVMLHEEPSELRSGGGTDVTEREESVAQELTDEVSPPEAHRKQLHDYLQKTRNVRGPSRDLIYQESRGGLFGLDEGFAAEIEDAAVNGRVQEVREIVEGSSDELTVERVLRFLVHLVQTALPGVEGENSASGLLAAADVAQDSPLRTVADQAIQAVLSHRSRSELQRDDLPGALSLALRSKDPRSGELFDGILATDEAKEDGLGMSILRHLNQLPSEVSADLLSNVVAERLLDPSTAAEATALVSDRPEVIQNALPAMIKPIQDRNAEGADVEDFEAFEVSLSTAIEERQTATVEALLQVPVSMSQDDEWRGMANEGLIELGAVTAPGLARAVLEAAVTISVEEANTWVTLISPELSANSKTRHFVHPLALRFWDRRSELGDAYDRHNESFISLLQKVRDLSPEAFPNPDLTEKALSATPRLVVGQEAVGEASWAHVRRFVEKGLIDAQAAARALLTRLIEYIQSASGPGAEQLVSRWIRWVATTSDGSSLTELIESLATSSVYSTPRREFEVLQLEKLRGDGSRYSLDDIRDLVTEHRHEATLAAASWLEINAHDSDGVWSLVSPYLEEGNYSQNLSEAVRVCAERLDLAEILCLYRAELAATQYREPESAFLRDIRSTELNDKVVADELVAAYERFATNENLRERIFVVWGVAPVRSRGAVQAVIDGIFIPTVQASKGGLAIAKRHPETWRSPEGRKNAVRDTLREAAGGKGNDKSLERLMEENGVVSVKRSVLGLRKQEVDE